MSTACRMVTATLVCMVVGVLLTSCASQTAGQVAQMAVSVAQVTADYEQARQALEKRVAQLPEPDATLWRDFIRDADAFKAVLEEMPPRIAMSPEAMAGVYETGVDLYVRARTLIGPDLRNMPLNDQILLRQMDSALRRLAEVYQAWIVDSQLVQHAEIAASGVELIKLALQIGATVL